MAFAPGLVQWAEDKKGEVGLVFRKANLLEGSWPRKTKNLAPGDLDPDPSGEDVACFVPFEKIWTLDRLCTTTDTQENTYIDALQPGEVAVFDFCEEPKSFCNTTLTCDGLDIPFFPAMYKNELGVVFNNGVQLMEAVFFERELHGTDILRSSHFHAQHEPFRVTHNINEDIQCYFVSCEKMMYGDLEPHRVVERKDLQFLSSANAASKNIQFVVQAEAEAVVSMSEAHSSALHKTPIPRTSKQGSDGGTKDSNVSGVTTNASKSSNSSNGSRSRSGSTIRFADSVSTDRRHSTRKVEYDHTGHDRLVSSAGTGKKQPRAKASAISDSASQLHGFLLENSQATLEGDDVKRARFAALLNAAGWKENHFKQTNEQEQDWWKVEKIIVAPWANANEDSDGDETEGEEDVKSTTHHNTDTFVKGLDYFWDQLDVFLLLKKSFPSLPRGNGFERPKKPLAKLILDYSDEKQWNLNTRLLQVSRRKFITHADNAKNDEDLVKLLLKSGWSKEKHPQVVQGDYAIDNGHVLIPHWCSASKHTHGITAENIKYKRTGFDYFTTLASVRAYLKDNGNEMTVVEDRRARSSPSESSTSSLPKKEASSVSSSGKKFGKIKTAYAVSPSATHREISAIAEEQEEQAIIGSPDSQDNSPMKLVKEGYKYVKSLLWGQDDDKVEESTENKDSSINNDFDEMTQAQLGIHDLTSPAIRQHDARSAGSGSSLSRGRAHGSSPVSSMSSSQPTPPKSDHRKYCDYLLAAPGDEKEKFHAMWSWLKKELKWKSCYKKGDESVNVLVPVWNVEHVQAGKFDTNDEHFKCNVDYFCDADKEGLISYLRNNGPAPMSPNNEMQQRRAKQSQKEKAKETVRAQKAKGSPNRKHEYAHQTPQRCAKSVTCESSHETEGEEMDIEIPDSHISTSSIMSLSPYKPDKTDYEAMSVYLLDTYADDHVAFWAELWDWLKKTCKWRCVYGNKNTITGETTFVHVPNWNTQYIVKGKLDTDDKRFTKNIDYFIENSDVVEYFKNFGPHPKPADGLPIVRSGDDCYSKYRRANEMHKVSQLQMKKMNLQAVLRAENLVKRQQNEEAQRKMEANLQKKAEKVARRIELDAAKKKAAASAKRAANCPPTPPSPPNDPLPLIQYIFEVEKDFKYQRVWKILKEDLHWANLNKKKIDGLGESAVWVPSWALSVIDNKKVDTEKFKGEGIHYFDDRDALLNYVRKFGNEGPPTEAQLKTLRKLDKTWWDTHKDPNYVWCPSPKNLAAQMQGEGKGNLKETGKNKKRRLSSVSSNKSKAPRTEGNTRVVTSAVIRRKPHNAAKAKSANHNIAPMLDDRMSVSGSDGEDSDVERDEFDEGGDDMQFAEEGVEEEEEDEEEDEESSDESEEEQEIVRHWARPLPRLVEKPVVPAPATISYSAIAAAASYKHNGTLAEAIELSQHACAPGNKKIGRIGREKEYAEIEKTLREAVTSRTGGNMYACGPPGTGKTHFTNAAVEELCKTSVSSEDSMDEEALEMPSLARDPETIFALTAISGVTPVYYMKTARSAAAEFVVVRTLGTTDSEASIYGKIFAAIFPFLLQTTRNSLKRDVTSGKRAGDGSGTKVSLAAKIKKAVLDHLSCSAKKPNRCMVILVVDEIDKAPQNVLRELLELARGSDEEAKDSGDSNLICMGIANSLNFPERIGLSGLAKPKVVLFCPYDYGPLFEIIRNRTFGLLDARSEALIARKVASKNGDVRLALQVAQQAIDAGIAALVKPPLSEEGEEGVRRVAAERAAQLAAPAKAVVNIACCLKVFQSIGMGASKEPDLISKLSAVSRALLVALLISDLGTTTPTQVPKMLQMYNSYAEEVHMHPLTKDELWRWLEQLIGYGLMRCCDDAGNQRRQVHQDKVNYRLQCEAVNVLRVPNLENIHRPHVQRFVDRKNKNNAEKARLLAENLETC